MADAVATLIYGRREPGRRPGVERTATRVAATRRAAASTGSCSQTRTTIQPAASSSAPVARRGPGCRRSLPPSSRRSSAAPGNGPGSRARSSRRGTPRPVAAEDDVGAARDRRDGPRVDPEPQAQPVERRPQGELRRRVSAAVAGMLRRTARSTPRTRVACPPEPETAGRRCGKRADSIGVVVASARREGAEAKATGRTGANGLGCP